MQKMVKSTADHGTEDADTNLFVTQPRWWISEELQVSCGHLAVPLRTCCGACLRSSAAAVWFGLLGLKLQPLSQQWIRAHTVFFM